MQPDYTCFLLMKSSLGWIFHLPLAWAYVTQKGGEEHGPESVRGMLSSQGEILVLSAVACDMSCSSLSNNVVVFHHSQMLKPRTASWYG